MKMSTSRSRKVRANEALYSGYGLSARGAPPAGYQQGVGSALLKAGATTVQKFGLPTPMGVYNQFYFHVRLVKNTTTKVCVATGWISLGNYCDSTADPSLASECINWITDNKFKSVSVKKRNNGSFGTFLVDQAATPLGNYIKIFEDQVPENQFDEFFKDPKTYYGPHFSESNVLMSTIGLLRECDAYVTPTIDSILTIDFSAAYTADANEETLWIQDAAGNLLSEVRLYENDLQGRRQFPIKKDQTYKVVIPGYSFRNYQLTFEESTKWVIEPVKLHFMGTLPDAARFYFKLEPGEDAKFCMKDYNRGAIESPYGATLTRMSDNFVVNCPLQIKNWFYEHDTFQVPIDPTVAQTWRVDLIGQGRTAMWLDGVPNIFAESASKYFRPTYPANTVTAKTPTFGAGTSVGKVPLFGCYSPYVKIPDGAVSDLFTSLKTQTTSMYTFADVMAANPNHENIFRQELAGKFGIQRDYTVLAKTGRISLFDYATDPIVQAGVAAWIDNMYRINDGNEHFLAAADEPNLGWPDFESFRKHFKAFADAVRANPKSGPAKVKIAVPASSRFDHGTTTENSAQRKGKDWSQQIVDLYPDLVDAIVWHDWTVHGLLNVRQYTTAIEAAYAQSNGGARRLCIEQTNTSGGSSVSLYHQNTQFATLWWAGIFAACTRTGKLDDLIWFLDHDELSHPKGLLYSNPEETAFSMKIVGYFQGWLGGYLKGASIGVSYPIDQPKIEVDLCAFTNVKASVTRKFIFGVNKSKRSYTMTLPNFNWGTSGVKLEFFNPNGTVSVVSPTINTGAQTCTFSVPAETVFMLSQGVV